MDIDLLEVSFKNIFKMYGYQSYIFSNGIPSILFDFQNLR